VKLLRHLKKRAGVQTFVGGFRDMKLNVAEYLGEPNAAP